MRHLHTVWYPSGRSAGWHLISHLEPHRVAVAGHPGDLPARRGCTSSLTPDCQALRCASWPAMKQRSTCANGPCWSAVVRRARAGVVAQLVTQQRPPSATADLAQPDRAAPRAQLLCRRTATLPSLRSTGWHALRAHLGRGVAPFRPSRRPARPSEDVVVPNHRVGRAPHGSAYGATLDGDGLPSLNVHADSASSPPSIWGMA